LRLASLDLLKIAELYRNDGMWMGKRIVSTAWVRASTTAHAQVDDTTEYGYFWWIKTFTANGKPYPAYFMSGNGGNKVVIVPDLKASVVITQPGQTANHPAASLSLDLRISRLTRHGSLGVKS
jgi:CubicO group peptidase (beta-lactamase class C family)